MAQFLLGFGLALLIAYAANRVRSLNREGAFAAAIVGTVVFGIGGWNWAVLLLAFFITSSSLSRAFKKNKHGLDEKFSKGHERDAGQVFGNGGLATAFAALHFIYPSAAWPWIGFAASLAAVNADTWATELGVLNPHPPRLITHPSRTVEKGTSGGVSFIGTLASLAGSGLIAILSVVLNPIASPGPALGIVTLAGFAGSLLDSLLGATLQAMYYCPVDRKETEKHPHHTCGARTLPLRGWKWLNNDWVNFACSAFGALFSLMLLGAI
jgi:uncharacterized protein (TIGR00297 family)